MRNLTTRDIIITLGVALVIVGAVFGAALQSNIWDGTSSSTIISDTEDPEINEAASTHGNLPDTGSDPVLLCYITEMDLSTCTAEILGRDWLGRYVKVLEEVEMSYVSKNGDIYKYRGTVTEDLEPNVAYKVRYTAEDRAGRTDEATLDLQIVELDGTVWVNDIEITSVDQTIYLQTHRLAIRAQVNQDPDDIQRIRLMLNGEEVEVLQYANGDYACTYDLPGDGEYDLIVQVLAVGGAEIRLASFHIGLNSGLNPMLIAGAAVALVAVAGLMYYLQKRQEA